MINISAQALYDESSVRQHQLGTLGVNKYGDRFRYVQAGAAALVVGHLVQEPAQDTNYRSMVVQAASAIGDTVVSITLGGTAVTANQFEEGDLAVESSAGLGQLFHIKEHQVQTSTTGTCTFTLDRPLKVALTTSSQVSVRKNAQDGVIDFPTTPTGGPIGIALYDMTIAYFGWVQSGGNTIALFDTGANMAADENAIKPSLGVAGAVGTVLEADVAPTHIGWGRELVSVDSTYSFVHLAID